MGSPESKTKIPASLPHIRAFSPMYSFNKFEIYRGGNSATSQPFALHRFFSKIGGARFPQPLVQKSEKKFMDVGLPGLFAESRTVSEIINREFFGKSPIFSKSVYSISPKNLIECIMYGRGLRRNLEV